MHARGVSGPKPLYIRHESLGLMTQMERAVFAGRGRGGSGSGCSARKAAKRAIFPWINGQIIAVADTGDLALLMSTIETHASEMNLVNIATAMHRLARLTAADPSAPALKQHPQQPLLQLMADRARLALERAQASSSVTHTQAMSNIAWSFATLHHVDLPLLQILADTAHERARNFKPFELTMILWAFAKLGSVDPAAWECSGALFKVASGEILRRPQDFPFRCLVMAVWAFATTGWRDPELYRGVAPRLARLAASGSCRELASAVWALGTACVREDALCLELARKTSMQLGCQEKEELAAVLGSLLVGGPLEPCTEKVRAAPRPKKAEPPGSAGGRQRDGFTGALRTAGPRAMGGEAAEDRRRRPPRRAEPAARGRRSGGKEQEVGSPGGCVESSEGEAEVPAPTSPTSPTRHPRRGSAAEAALSAPFSSLASGVVVKNSFLHVEVEDDDEDSGPPLRPLPPSLEIIPKDVCPEKLAAYRMDYQRFRAGRATGARGEVISSTARRERSC